MKIQCHFFDRLILEGNPGDCLKKTFSSSYSYLKFGKKLLSSFLILVIIGGVFFNPPWVQAANVFKKIFKGIKRTSRFIVNLPDKATRWMGPVIGPIAADILTQNMVRNPRFGNLFRHARQIDKNIKNVEDQKKYLYQIQKSFRDQSQELRSQAEKIRDIHKNLSQELIKGNISLDDYKEKVVALDNLADSYERAADKFTQGADRIRPNNLIKMVGRNVWREMVRQVRDGVMFEVKREVEKYIDPRIIKTLVSGESLSFDDLLDILISGDIAVLAGKNKDINIDEFKTRVRDRLKEILQENKDALKDNWKEKVDQVIKQVMADLEKNKKNLEKPEEIVSPKTETEESDSRCPSGYEFCPQCGVDCRQKNCNDIKGAHWSYTGQCVCGSAGSVNENPEDSNKVCSYPQEYKACPGCVYQCIHVNESCPKKLQGL